MKKSFYIWKIKNPLIFHNHIKIFIEQNAHKEAFMKKFLYYSLFIFLISLSIILSFGFQSFAAYPKLVNKLISAFEDIKSYIIAIATPIAAVAIGSGFLMQKFSLGDEERIRTGKKLIRTSIISYTFILTLDLVVNLIKGLIS